MQLTRFAGILIAAVLGLAVFAAPAPAAKASQPPNVVVILADDVGYGDLGCYGATQVRTPNIDRLAREGRRFTDAHSPSSVCTPTRYALMTGHYAWRHRPAASILNGVAPLCIATDRLTLAGLFHSAGYATGAVGKWHLGLGTGTTDYNQPIKPGPLEIGFDSFFGLPATGDRTPCVYVENHAVVGYDPADPIRVGYGAAVGDEPTGKDHPELLTMKPSHGHDNTIINGISRIGYMAGGQKARWVDQDMADVFTRKATDFIEQHRQGPFLLYFATHDIHVPRVPHPRFAGRSQHGTRGDVIEEFDHTVGDVLAALDRAGIADRTLVILTSDNGGILDDGYQDGSGNDTSGHRPNGALRGAKGNLFEGGHRVPFIVRWPGHVAPGKSDALVCHVDLLASCAALLGRPLPSEAGPDSVNVLPAWLGASDTARQELVHHTGGYPGALAIRRGPWKLVQASRPGNNSQADLRSLLFNLANDPAEQKDLAAAEPQTVAELSAALAAARQQSRRP